MFLIKLKRLIETLAQLRQVLQRTTQERNITPDGTSACKTRDSLRHHRLKNGSSNVFLQRAFVQQRLHVGFRENAAAACNGINGGVLGSQLVQAARIGVQKACHLVDERARAAGARAVHALLDAVVEEDDLCVFATQLNGNVRFGDERLNCGFAGNNFLHELNVEPLRQKQATRAGNGNGQRQVAVFHGGFLEHFHDGRAHVRVVAAIHRPQDFVLIVQNCKFDSG